MKICKKCILDENFPGITFNDQGICSLCQRAHNFEEHASLMSQYRDRFKALLEKRRGRGPYDVLMAYSGGKDSTYTLDLFVNEYGLQVLALTFDNGFISPFAIENIQRITDQLGVDHVFLRPNFPLLKRIFTAAARKDLFPPKALERASSICTSCIGFVKSILLKMAIEKGIPFVGFGWSPGQAPVQSSVMQTNPRLVSLTQRGFWPMIEEVAGEDLSRFYLSSQDLSRPITDFPVNVHPLAFHPYDEEGIKTHIRNLGWQETPDTDPNSSNCLLNAYANQVHLQRWGFHPYAWEMAGIVRAGGISREQALAKIHEPPDKELVEMVKGRLGLG